jgi:mono/diheme cytochrome c family protein
MNDPSSTHTALVSMLLVMTAVVCTGLTGTDGYGKTGSEEVRRGKGKTLYVRHCAGCHGPEGEGDGYKLLGADPANLTSPSIRKKSDAALLNTIHEGKPNMPSWKLRLSEQDSRAVLAYIRTLAKQNK